VKSQSNANVRVHESYTIIHEHTEPFKELKGKNYLSVCELM